MSADRQALEVALAQELAALEGRTPEAPQEPPRGGFRARAAAVLKRLFVGAGSALVQAFERGGDGGLWTHAAAAVLRRFERAFGRVPKPQPTPLLTSPVWRAVSPARDLCGLALSGGGIRSATFNLGLLQGLHTHHLLEGFDYLATISGGGYIGSFWTAWRQRRRANPTAVFPTKAAGEAEPREIRHLREFSNHLRPRLTLISSETGRIGAVVIGALLPSLLTAASVVVLTQLAWVGLLWEVSARGITEGLLALGGLVLAVHILLALGAAARRRHIEEADPLETFVRWFVWLPIGLAVALAAWWVLWHAVPLPFSLVAGPVALADAGAAQWLAVQLPAIALLVAVVTLTVLRWLLSRLASGVKPRRYWQGSLDAVIARHGLVAIGWSVLGLLWVTGQVVAAAGVTELLSAFSAGAGGGAFAAARQLFRAQPNKPTGGKLALLAAPAVLKALATVALGAAAVTSAALLTSLYGRWGASGQFAAAGGAVIVITLALLFFDPREVGFHSFYRARLVRSYLGASNLSYPRATAECCDDDVLLRGLSAATPARPLHLVCCTANDLGGDPLGTLHRGGDSAVLTPFGFQMAGHFRPWRVGDDVTLGSAMTASAAAFNSHMGSASMGLGAAATFLLAALNVRLGLWMENPNHLRCGKRRLASLFPGLLFFRELFGLSNLFSRHVYLSDGGHFENLGLYELVRRHCRFILVSDCGADPDVAFDDLGTAIRRVREDFGVEVSIDVSPLRRGADGRSQQAVVAGDVTYPGGDKAVVLYVKPALVGGEPADIAQYAGRNATFPHETTLDQFYDEAQWEAYRRLGQHVAEVAFARVRSLIRAKPPVSLPMALAQARYEWMEASALQSGELRQLERDWSRLEEDLWGSAIPLRDRVLLGQHPVGAAAAPNGASLTTALPFVRRALELMEEVIRVMPVGGALGATHFGWLNRLGRWVSTPELRFWWPWLGPLHTRDLARFVTKRFEMGSLRFLPGKVRPVDPRSDQGFAAAQWRVLYSGKRTLPGQAQGFLLPLDGGTSMLLAAFVAYEDKNGARCWNNADFFIPQGLWAIGLGERFLRRLVRRLPKSLQRIEVSTGKECPQPPVSAMYTSEKFVWENAGRFVWTR